MPGDSHRLRESLVRSCGSTRISRCCTTRQSADLLAALGKLLIGNVHIGQVSLSGVCHPHSEGDLVARMDAVWVGSCGHLQVLHRYREGHIPGDRTGKGQSRTSGYRLERRRTDAQRRRAAGNGMVVEKESIRAPAVSGDTHSGFRGRRAETGDGCQGTRSVKHVNRAFFRGILRIPLRIGVDQSNRPAACTPAADRCPDVRGRQIHRTARRDPREGGRDISASRVEIRVCREGSRRNVNRGGADGKPHLLGG